MTENLSKLPFTNARLLAIQTLYAHETGDTDWDKLMSRALLGELGGQVLTEQAGSEAYISLAPADTGLYTRLVQSYREHGADIDNALRSAISAKIGFDRSELTFLCILRVGMAEFYADAQTDAPIIVNEYVDITQSFFDGAEIKIANAVLDRFAKVMRGA